ncbi:hypothetical protein PLICRDRAFT_181054 [Plicaturopsis crispa FD-325 SS-3]|uniref:Uncharacterized protein n=1 Tax=Plicaturopsis crispa FD-325 SS-3 TaxID=944288 RepID=A0A0C9SPM4_PLICR|nr:hypothetical protein PLICRDRAFT_181054 [Plicaturopsis crispa FD-325 SS-3]
MSWFFPFSHIPSSALPRTLAPSHDCTRPPQRQHPPRPYLPTPRVQRTAVTGPATAHPTDTPSPHMNTAHPTNTPTRTPRTAAPCASRRQRGNAASTRRYRTTPVPTRTYRSTPESTHRLGTAVHRPLPACSP